MIVSIKGEPIEFTAVNSPLIYSDLVRPWTASWQENR